MYISDPSVDDAKYGVNNDDTGLVNGHNCNDSHDKNNNKW